MLTRLTEPRWRNDILLDVTWAKIAKRYFGKSPSWMYNKLNGTDGNGGVLVARDCVLQDTLQLPARIDFLIVYLVEPLLVGVEYVPEPGVDGGGVGCPDDLPVPELVLLDNEACDDVARFVLVTDGDAYFVRAVLQDFRLENG